MNSPSRRGQRRYRKAQDRRVWVFSELNHDLRPEIVARIITAAGLEQARREADARAQATAAEAAGQPKGDGHA